MYFSKNIFKYVGVGFITPPPSRTYTTVVGIRKQKKCDVLLVSHHEDLTEMLIGRESKTHADTGEWDRTPFINSTLRDIINSIKSWLSSEQYITDKTDDQAVIMLGYLPRDCRYLRAITGVRGRTSLFNSCFTVQLITSVTGLV